MKIIPDDSILVKVASPSISTNRFFESDYYTLDALSTPYWTKDSVTKPGEKQVGTVSEKVIITNSS